MEVQDIKIKSSFFDDDNIENVSLWKKENSLKKLSDVKIMEGNLFKKSSRTKFWKSRYYVLFEDRLAYFKVSIYINSALKVKEWTREQRTVLLFNTEHKARNDL